MMSTSYACSVAWLSARRAIATGASAASAGREPGAHLRGEGLELRDRRGTVHVGADQEHFLALLLHQPARELADRRGLARALKPREHDDHRTLRAQIEARARLAHEAHELLVHHFDEGLSGSQALGDLHARRRGS